MECQEGGSKGERRKRLCAICVELTALPALTARTRELLLEVAALLTSVNFMAFFGLTGPIDFQLGALRPCTAGRREGRSRALVRRGRKMARTSGYARDFPSCHR